MKPLPDVCQRGMRLVRVRRVKSRAVVLHEDFRDGVCVPCPDQDAQRSGIGVHPVLYRIFHDGLQGQRRQAEADKGRIVRHDKHIVVLGLFYGQVRAGVLQLRGEGDGAVTGDGVEVPAQIIGKIDYDLPGLLRIQPGYHGVERFNDHDKMVEMLVESDREGMSVHVHSEGGGATHFMLGCIEDAEKITGDKDQRNVLAHLHFVTDEDIRRMAETGSIPAVAPLWTPEVPGNYEVECSYVGKELADQSYPIKSFFDAGANVVFHSDYPVSPLMNIKYSIYTAEKRVYPDDVLGGKDSPRNIGEAITREQSLRAMTINVARQWHQEHRMGSIEFGKLANMTVFDCDFLHDDIEKVAQANVIATIVDGEEVYRP